MKTVSYNGVVQEMHDPNRLRDEPPDPWSGSRRGTPAAAEPAKLTGIRGLPPVAPPVLPPPVPTPALPPSVAPPEASDERWVLIRPDWADTRH